MFILLQDWSLVEFDDVSYLPFYTTRPTLVEDGHGRVDVSIEYRLQIDAGAAAMDDLPALDGDFAARAVNGARVVSFLSRQRERVQQHDNRRQQQ